MLTILPSFAQSAAIFRHKVIRGADRFIVLFSCFACDACADYIEC